jgi:hypothetical protein
MAAWEDGYATGRADHPRLYRVADLAESGADDIADAKAWAAGEALTVLAQVAFHLSQIVSWL